METQVCKNFEKCPIYNGILKDKEATSSGYKRQYCEAGEKGWSACKRYLVKGKTGKCPPNLLPNSMLSVDDIIANMN
jgi:hypothetical protein